MYKSTHIFTCIKCITGCEALPVPGSVYCKLHKEEQTPALTPNNISKETLQTLNKENRQRTAELERDSIFVIEKILGKKEVNGKIKYHIKWENYKKTTWEIEDNVPKIFRNYYNTTGNENIPEPRIKHLKKVGSTVYHLLSWDEENIYWEKDTAFSISGVEESAKREEFNCQTRKVS